MVEDIPDQDCVSRLMFEPAMRVDQEIIWINTFMFKTENNYCESLVWRKYAPTLNEVHAIGCVKQTTDRAGGRPQSTYIGCIDSVIGEIREIRSAKGAQFAVVHAPKEGQHHAHITFAGKTSKADRTELKFLLKGKFGPLNPHSCPEVGEAAESASISRSI